MDTMLQTKKIACFDVDGTIFRSSLLIELVDVLIEQGRFPREAREQFAQSERDWIDRKGSYETYIGAVIASFIAHVSGVSISEMDKAADVVIERNRNRVYRFTRDLLKTLQKDGYHLVAISHSPQFMLDRFCREYGFDKIYGRRYVVDGAYFTGEVFPEDLFGDKAKTLLRACEEGGFTLDDSVAVGDTEGDIPMLSLVAQPLCFNPNATLYAHAKTKGWRVIVERKDVVYEIGDSLVL